MKKLKQFMISMSVTAVILGGCGSQGVPQADYDRVVAERDEYKNQSNFSNDYMEIKQKIVQYKTALEKDYERILLVIEIYGKQSNADVSELSNSLKDNYQSVIKNLETVENTIENTTDLENAIKDGNELIEKNISIWETIVDAAVPLQEYILSEDTQSNKNENIENSTILYEDEKVKISFAEINEKGVAFWVENLTDVNITIQADSVSINGISTNSIMMSDDVAPKSKGKVVAKCNDFSVNTKVETVGGQLSIIDFEKSFKSYKASFVNIPIE